MDCSTPGFAVHHELLEMAQTHVYQVGDAIPPSPVHDLMSFSLEKCLCLVMSSVTGASAVTVIPYPHPPGIVRISASLFLGPDLELTNVCHPIQPSHPLLFPSPSTFNLSQCQGLFQ